MDSCYHFGYDENFGGDENLEIEHMLLRGLWKSDLFLVLFCNLPNEITFPLSLPSGYPRRVQICETTHFRPEYQHCA